MSSFLWRWWKEVFLCQPHGSLALLLHSKAWHYSSFSSQVTQSTDSKKKKKKMFICIYTLSQKYKLSLCDLKGQQRYLARV